MSLKKILNGSKPIRWPNGLSRFEIFIITQAKKNVKKYHELKEEFEGVKKEFEGIKQNNEGYADYKNMTLTSDENGNMTATFKEEDRVYHLNENNDEPEVLDKEKKTLKDKLFTPNTEITIDLYNLHGYIACISDYIEKLNQIAEIITAGFDNVSYQDYYCYRSICEGHVYHLKALFDGFEDFDDDIYGFNPEWTNYKFDNFEYAALTIKTDKDALDTANETLNKFFNNYFDILLKLLEEKRTLIKEGPTDNLFYSYILKGILYTDKFIEFSFKILARVDYMKDCTRRSYMNLYKYGIKEEIKEEDTTMG